jgi:histone deacetylase 1/2
LIKDQVTKRVLFRGRCRRGLYHLVPQDWRSIKQAFNVTKIPSSRWHSRLGHPSFSTIQRVLRNNKLSFLDDSSIDSVCDSYQRAKSRQLTYPTSSSVSNFPLELIFSDVWGPAATSVGRFSYYVSFIDDFSKYTWIYLIKKKSDVFDVFNNFQALVERQFGRKILSH